MAQYNSLLDFQTGHSHPEGESSTAASGSGISPSANNSTHVLSMRQKPDYLWPVEQTRTKKESQREQDAHFLRRMEASGVCKACSDVDLCNKYPSTHHTWSNLSLSATQGCPVCQFIVRNFKGFNSNRSAELAVDLSKSTLSYRVPDDGGGKRMNFELFNKSGLKNHP